MPAASPPDGVATRFAPAMRVLERMFLPVDQRLTQLTLVASKQEWRRYESGQEVLSPKPRGRR